MLFRSQQPGFNLGELLLKQEGYYIDAALQLAQDNVSVAAKLLGLQRTTLYSRMEVLQKHKANNGYPKAIEEAN